MKVSNFLRLRSVPAELERRQRFIWAVCTVSLAFVVLAAIPQFYFGLYGLTPVVICITVAFATAGLLNHVGRVEAAGNLLPVTMSVLLFWMVMAQGWDAGGYLYFLPLIVGLPFVINYNSPPQLLFHIAHPTAAVLLLNFMESPPWVSEITAAQQAVFHKMNLVFSVLLCQFFVYEIIVTNTRSEQSLRESEARLRRQNEELTKINQELDRFVYSVSHDLRAPVASALGLTDLM
nr:hypothetical protein [Cytophagales bacterium]